MSETIEDGAGGSVVSGDKLTRGRAFGHGKVILLGEHAVVYDQPALAAGLSLGVWATVVDGTGHLWARAWGLDAHAGDGTAVGQALMAIMRRMGVDDVDVHVEGDLPARAGLGSSAALGFAVARAIADARGGDPDLALAAAHDAEVVFHGTPSGIDLAVASSGDVGRFQRGAGWRSVPVLQPITLCVGLSGRPRDTRSQVDAVRRLRDRTPAAAGVIGALGALTPAGERALALGDVDELGRLFDIAHGLLAALRVSCAELDALVHAARAAGALGAKLTGAGGGGAVIALAPRHEHDVLARWREAGFTGFLATIGQEANAPTRREGCHDGPGRRVDTAGDPQNVSTHRRVTA